MVQLERLFHRRWPLLVAVALALPLLGGAKGGCGSKENNDKLESPVQAVASLLERADGTVEAQVYLISTAKNPSVFVETARNVRVRVPPTGIEVPLAMTAPGLYSASSKSAPDLKYVAKQDYRFRFDLDDAELAKDNAGGDFTAVITTPDDTVTASMAKPPAFAGGTSQVAWTPATRQGVVVITDAAGAITYSTFDFTQPVFDGSKWARLKAGGKLELSVDVFPRAGSYTVSVCAVTKVSDFDKSLSVDLGVASGVLAGRCAADIPLTVAN
jgi:hypothetical protein